MQLLCLELIFWNAPFIESNLLQTTQHDDAIGGRVATAYFGYNLPVLLQCCHYKPCKRLGSHLLPKVKATLIMKYHCSNTFWSTQMNMGI